MTSSAPPASALATARPTTRLLVERRDDHRNAWAACARAPPRQAVRSKSGRSSGRSMSASGLEQRVAQAGPACARPSVWSQHGVGAPGDVVAEERGERRRSAASRRISDEVVAAVLGRPEHDVGVGEQAPAPRGSAPRSAQGSRSRRRRRAPHPRETPLRRPPGAGRRASLRPVARRRIPPAEPRAHLPAGAAVVANLDR